MSDVRKRLKTRAKINTVESWSVGQLERKRKNSMKRAVSRKYSVYLVI